MRQVILIILTTFLATNSFSQTTLKINSSNQTLAQKPIDNEEFSISTKDTLKYQFKTERNKYFTVDIGSINYGQRLVNYNFYITNNSDTPLVITDAYWAEPIFSPSYEDNPIRKGQEGLFTYKLRDTRRPGPFSKTGQVKTNLGDFFIQFHGINLPQHILIDRPIKIDTVKLGDEIISEFKIYNNSDSSTLIIENIQTNSKTTIIYDNDEVNKYENAIPPNSYRTFKATFIPEKIGISSSKIIIKINTKFNKDVYRMTEVVHFIFATVQQLKKKNKPKAFRKKA